MNNPLRVRLAKAMGWTQAQIDAVLKLEAIRRKYDSIPRKDSFSGLAIESEYQAQLLICEELNCPADRLPKIDSNTVREVWKTLTPDEKSRFIVQLIKKLKIEVYEGGFLNVVFGALEKALDAEPTTLAEIYCEVKISQL
jgi:hypothetical protein